MNATDRVLDTYYAEIRALQLFSSEEERQLFADYRTCKKCCFAYRTNDTSAKCPKCATPRNFKARDKLIGGALRFVLKVAKDYSRRARGLSYEADLLKALVSAGNLGLLVAVDRFEPERKNRFLTYAAWWIREKILEELDNSGVIRVPAHLQKALRAKRKLADSADLDTAHVTLETVTAVDQSHGEERLEQALINDYGIDALHQALAVLQFRERDKYIVLAYFGKREDPKNLRQISRRLDISSERVRQIKRQALDLLRGHLATQQVSATTDLFTA